jgi:hypothetical protein
LDNEIAFATACFSSGTFKFEFSSVRVGYAKILIGKVVSIIINDSKTCLEFLFQFTVSAKNRFLL